MIFYGPNTWCSPLEDDKCSFRQNNGCGIQHDPKVTVHYLVVFSETSESETTTTESSAPLPMLLSSVVVDLADVVLPLLVLVVAVVVAVVVLGPSMV